MSHTQILDRIRRQVVQAFQDLQLGEEIDETILIRNGHYCGRRFRTEHGSAIWFLEENQIKVYSAEGEVLCVRSGSSAPPAERRAA